MGADNRFHGNRRSRLDTAFRAAIFGQAVLLALAGSMLGVCAHAQSSTSVSTGLVPALPIMDSLEVNVGRSRTIQTPWLLKQVAVAAPEIADVEVLDTDKVLLVGIKSGTTDLTIWGEEGQVWHMEVIVQVDIEQLGRNLAKLFPGSSLSLTRSNDVVFVSGTVENTDQVQQLHKYFEVSEVKYVDMTAVPGLHQVQLKVRVAEANRIAMRKLGVNALSVGEDHFGASLIGSESGGSLTPINIGPPENVPAQPNIPFVFNQDVNVSSFVTLLAGFPGEDLEFFIQALAENQYLRILAEPNLVALSGEEASFLAGGEFPIPIVQGGGAGGGSSITIEYKEFGIRLKFLPTVMGENKIRLSVAPEVSDISEVGSVEIQGFNIPSILTRRAQTTIDLKSGQSFAIAGLLNSTVNARNSRVPLLGDLPVLGSMFRSTQYQQGETELVVLVTADLVEPTSNVDVPPLPGDLHVQPTDWELFLTSTVEGKARKQPFFDNGGHNIEGFEKLKGPGPWATYHETE